MKSHRANRCYPDAFIVQDLNRCTEIQYTLLGHFFNFSTTAVKRSSTFQGILVLLSFNASIIMKSHRANRCYPDAFIVQDLNRCTEIQYPLFRHFFNFSTTAECIQLIEVTSGQQVLSRCFHCARPESMYWYSVYTFGALLQFQYHSCEEIVYFSRDCSTTFIQCIH